MQVEKAQRNAIPRPNNLLRFRLLSFFIHYVQRKTQQLIPDHSGWISFYSGNCRNTKLLPRFSTDFLKPTYERILELN